MTRFPFGWRLLAALASLSSTIRSQDSINLDVEVLDQIDLRALGTPNLDRHKATFDVAVDDTCSYLLMINFTKNKQDDPGAAVKDTSFTGVCDPTKSGKAPDGNPWHMHRRNWLQFPDYVEAATGFNHMSMYWRPCGLPPKGLRQPRYDVSFYMVIPQYRAFWTCDEMGTPSICSYNQSSYLGRGHFSIPRLERDPNFLANMPLNYQPDPLEPQALQYEGLVSNNPELVPETPEDWILPQMDMKTYDGDTVTWTALLPYSYISGVNSSVAYFNQYYVYQTMPRLPRELNLTYDASTGLISLFIGGSAGLCGDGFVAAKLGQGENVTRKLLE